MSTPESLNLWDRFFNRYRKTVLNRGVMVHTTRHTGAKYEFNYVDYTVTDRVTGSETIERHWLHGAPPDLESY